MRIFHGRRRVVRDSSFIDQLAMRVVDRLRDVSRSDFAHAVWTGAGSEQAAALKTIGVLDVRDTPVEGDIEQFPYEAGSLDLIVAVGHLHTVNDLPGALVQMRRALKPDGLFLAAIPGGETLFELRDSQMRVAASDPRGAAPRVHPMIDLQTWAGLMQRAGFALPVVDAERVPVFYRTLDALLRDIKKSGEGARQNAPSPYAGRAFWPAVAADYAARHSDSDGLLRATVEILYAIGWGPAEAQQQPLRPGSAQNRLADVLGGTETPLPDKARPH